VNINKLLKKTPITLPAQRAGDPRLGHLIPDNLEDPQIVIIGFPSDTGVRVNRGRVGAAKAPDRIRQFLYSLAPDAENFDAFSDLLKNTLDCGDLIIKGDLASDQESLALVVEHYIKKGAIPVVIGGGHETFFGHFLGFVKAGKAVHILNWDAHLDVREFVDGAPHSGSMFRQALLHDRKLCKGYQVAGAQRHSVAKDHLDFVRAHNGDVIWNEQLQTDLISEVYTELAGPTMVSFDIDAVDSSHAPGVSAPAVNGISPYLWLFAARLAGESGRVASFDIVEVNPEFDQDNRTSRLAAVTIWEFFRGTALRKSGSSSLPLSLDQAYKKIERTQKKGRAA